jgi:hypothetical protein
LAEIIAKLKEKYHTGICSDYSDVECFHHQPTNQHFILNHTKKIVWVVQIVSVLS